MHQLENSSAAKVFAYFEALSQIPRGSGNEKAASDAIKKWAEEKGFAVTQDKANNLVVKKPGAPGYENSPAVILQSHIDMVCEKNKDSNHDFLKDPISVLRDGDFLTADGTTLGGDNGVGVAMTQAVLDSELPHPPIEAVFTTGEEVGMLGANDFDMSQLSGKIFLNMDSEEEGVFTVSNAGGKHAAMRIPAEKAPAGGLSFLKLDVTGLHGGHSGLDINKERANANRLMGRLLCTLRAAIPELALAEIEGGSKENAIPRECSAVVGVPAGSVGEVKETAETLQATFRHEYKNTDGAIEVNCGEAAAPAERLSADTLTKVLAALMLVPNGIQSMSTDIDGLVESSNNLGVIVTEADCVKIIYAIRSSVGSRKEAIFQQMNVLAGLLGAKTEVLSDYPAWEYRPDSKVREVFCDSYKALTGKDAVVTALHAGLECGIFSDRITGIDAISFGPNLYDVHSPQERMSISSTEGAWELLQHVLAKLK